MPDVVDTDITPTWLDIYEFIRAHWRKHGYAPSQSEIMREIGCSSASVQNAFRVLRKHGHITYQKSVPRSIKPVDINRRLWRTPPDPWASLDEIRI